MNYYLIGYGALLSGAVALFSFLGGAVEGAALAYGVSVGMSIIVGYTVGRPLALLPLVIERRLLAANLRRLSSVAAQLGLPLSAGGHADAGRPFLACVVVAGTVACAAIIPPATVLTLLGALLAAADLPERGGYLTFAAGLGGLAALCLTTAVAVTLYYRGRIEWTAFRASVARDTETWRRRGRAVERTLRLRPA